MLLTEEQFLPGPSKPPADAAEAGVLGLRAGRAPQGRRSGYGLADVIGADDRRQVWDAYLPPWRYICSLVLLLDDRAVGTGTAWFAGPKFLVTAGHCLKHRKVGRPFDAVDIIPARAGGKEPFGRIRVPKKQFRLHPRWAAKYERQRDAGAILLNDPVRGVNGWFAAAAVDSDELQGWLVNVAGYPDEVQVPSRRVVGGDQLWVHSDAVDEVRGERLCYAIDTSGGQSGGPVFIYRDDMKTPIVVGIHAYGFSTTLAGLTDERNTATRIDADLMSHLKAWKAETDD